MAIQYNAQKLAETLSRANTHTHKYALSHRHNIQCECLCAFCRTHLTLNSSQTNTSRVSNGSYVTSKSFAIVVVVVVLCFFYACSEYNVAHWRSRCVFPGFMLKSISLSAKVVLHFYIFLTWISFSFVFSLLSAKTI